MKNYYALIHFDGIYVNGFLAIGHEDSESARLSIIKSLTDALNGEENKNSSEANRARQFRRSFTKPHRKNKRDAPVLEMIELPANFIMQAGYWLSLGGGEDYKQHLCNLPRQRTEHPKGYVISTLD